MNQGLPFSKSINKDFFNFIRLHANENISDLILRYKGKDLGFDLDFALVQIEGRQRLKKKTQAFLSFNTLIPDLLATEQASNEIIAKFHAEIAGRNQSVLDMTAGLGIDALAMAINADSMTACDTDLLKTEIFRYNTEVLNRHNIKIVNQNAINFLENHDGKFDLIFIDPSRRDDGQRLYNLNDCQPNILQHIEVVKEKGKRLLIKCSPMLDVTQTIKDLKDNVSSIKAVSLNGECKELLIEIKNNSINDNPESVLCEAINLNSDGSAGFRFSFDSSDINHSKLDFITGIDLITKGYLYDPGASVMKFSPWNILTDKFPGIKKLSRHAHLFFYQEYLKDFPGRKLKITKIIEKKDRQSLKGTPVNVVTKDFPISAERLQRELGLKSGENQFIYAVKINGKSILFLCELIKT